MAKRKSRKGSYKFTARRRVALKKAQTVSARKRKGRGVQNGRSGGVARSVKVGSGYKANSKTKRNLAIGASVVGVTALTTAGVVARHKLSGSSFERHDLPVVSGQLKTVTGSRAASFNKTKLGDQTGELKSHPYVQVNLATGEKKDVTRQVSGGSVDTGTVYTYNSKKQGPLGSSFSLSYTHRPLRMSRGVAGRRIRSRVEETVINGGIKYRGGVEVLPITQFIKGKPVSIESKEIPDFVPELPRSRATVHGIPLNDYLASLRRRHPV